MEHVSPRSGPAIGPRRRGRPHPDQRRPGCWHIPGARRSDERRLSTILGPAVSCSPNPRTRATCASRSLLPSMPALTFPVDLDGMLLPVLIGLNGNETAARAAAAQPIPLPVSVKAIVDTGTNVTCVSQAVLSRLSVAASGQGTTNTAAGEAIVQLYEVSLSIPGQGNAPLTIVGTNLTVMELPGSVPGVEVLVGLDVLLRYKLLLDGPAKQYTLKM